MMRVVFAYLRDEVFPRLNSILRGSELWIAIALAATIGLTGDRWLLGTIKILDAAIVLLTYCAIALGFCVAGLTIALTLPDREFAKKLANLHPRGDSCDSYSDLLFVFSWTAVCHWCAILAVVIGLLVGGASEPILTLGAPTTRRIMVAVISGMGIYSFAQFLITLITLSQVGRTYIRILKDK